MWSSTSSAGYSHYEETAAREYDHQIHLDLNHNNNIMPIAADNNPNFNMPSTSRLRPLIPKPPPPPPSQPDQGAAAIVYVSSSTTPPAINITSTSTFHGVSSDPLMFSLSYNHHHSASQKEMQALHYNQSTTAAQQQVTSTVSSSRWNPTPEQLQTLEELYRRGTRTPSTEQIQHITAQLSKYGKIEGKNVFYWFQNHKARERQKRRRRELDHHLDGANTSVSAAAGITTTAANISIEDDRPGFVKQTAADGAGNQRADHAAASEEEKMAIRNCYNWLQPPPTTTTTHCSTSTSNIAAAASGQQHITHEIAGVVSTQRETTDDRAVISSSTEGRRRTSSEVKDYYCYFYNKDINSSSTIEPIAHDDGDDHERRRGENVMRSDHDHHQQQHHHHHFSDMRAASTSRSASCSTGSLSRGWNDTWHGQNSSTFSFPSCCPTATVAPNSTCTANMIMPSSEGSLEYAMDIRFLRNSVTGGDQDDSCATLQLFPLKTQHMKSREQDHDGEEGGLLDGNRAGYDDRHLGRQIQFYEFL